MSESSHLSKLSVEFSRGECLSRNQQQCSCSAREEEEHPEQRQATSPTEKLDPDLIQYVADRLRKLKPSKKEALFNSIGAMFKIQGGISDLDQKRIFSELVFK